MVYKSKNTPLILLMYTLLTVSSCQMTGNEKGIEESNGRERVEQIWHPHLFFSKQRNVLSFPLWFNEKEICRKGISRITFLKFDKGDSIPVGQEKNTIPNESFEYVFRANGTVSALAHKTFLNGYSIGESNFRFQDFQAPNGHSEVQVQNSASEGYNLNGITQNSTWQVFDFLDSGEFSSRYQKVSEDQRLFIVPNKKYWNPLDIDKKVKPRSQDKVILGTSMYPQKIYQVANMVEERNITQFFYRNGFIHQVREDNFPFSRKTTFEYTNEGLCVGFIDSMFSAEMVVESKRTIFHYTPDSLPYRIEHLQRTEGGDFRQLEVFQYEFFEDSLR